MDRMTFEEFSAWKPWGEGEYTASVLDESIAVWRLMKNDGSGKGYDYYPGLGCGRLICPLHVSPIKSKEKTI